MKSVAQNIFSNKYINKNQSLNDIKELRKILLAISTLIIGLANDTFFILICLLIKSLDLKFSELTTFFL